MKCCARKQSLKKCSYEVMYGSYGSTCMVDMQGSVLEVLEAAAWGSGSWKSQGGDAHNGDSYS